MNSNRKIAIIVGILYIAATVAGILIGVVLMPIIEEPVNLMNVSTNENRVIIGALFELIMAVAVAGIAFMIYPILRQIKEGLALWYVGTRITEGVLFIVGIISLLSLLPLSQEFVKAGAPDASYFQTGGTLLLAASDHALMLGQTVFCVGALMLYYLLYQSRLIPRWLSVWGLIGVPLFVAAGFLLLFGGDPNSTLSTLLYSPLGLQEMVLAVWLIVKGFNSSAIASASAKTEIN